MEITEKMDCPEDLSEWVNNNPKAMWFVYDLNLMPEQITNRGEVCALRGFKKGWEARGLKEAAQQSVQLTALRRWLAVSIFINVILLAVVLFTIGGN
jgi:hypothetical protein